MKIQLDTSKKTIKLEENVKLSVFINLLKKLLPNNEWKEYTLETQTTITHWHSPVVIDRWYDRPYEYKWTLLGTGYVANKTNADYSLKKEGSLTMSTVGQTGSIYNIEVSNKLL